MLWFASPGNCRWSQRISQWRNFSDFEAMIGWKTTEPNLAGTDSAVSVWTIVSFLNRSRLVSTLASVSKLEIFWCTNASRSILAALGLAAHRVSPASVIPAHSSSLNEVSGGKERSVLSWKSSASNEETQRFFSEGNPLRTSTKS